MNPLPDFSAFFRALWGYDPFPWQSRLARHLADGGTWPSWVTLPTGTGKTSVLDIAVYQLALQASLPPDKRTAPVRIVFAVNRRIVVDEAFDRAARIAEKIKGAIEDSGNPLHPVAAALRSLGGLSDAPPLEAFPLRGGTFTDHSWARTPTQPLVLTTTLDQLGSRLLFRGYGVSEFARPVHASLLANDALLILDEAHTSKAFSQTLAAIERFRQTAQEPLASPFRTVQLTATPPDTASDPFSLDDADHAHPIIAKRIAASKPATLHVVEKATGTGRHSKMANAMTEHAMEFLDQGARRILLVVNRVATAEALRNRLAKEKSVKNEGATVELLTGRIRPLDRDALIERLVDTHQLKSDTPAEDVPPLLLVATQTIEVGADFDFDALVTELAPLDSLRQRFGRLNRYGRDIQASSAIVAPSEALPEEGKEEPDLIYGDCLPKVWAWLHSADGSLDFGIDAMAERLAETKDPGVLLAPGADAPILLPAHLDLLCQTSPAPHEEPEPSLYIHGPGREFPEVGVVLRSDIGMDSSDEKIDVATLATSPPIGTESASIPLHMARNWLTAPAKAKAKPIGEDAPENIAKPSQAAPGISPDLPRIYRWSNGEASLLVAPSDLRPGDTLVLPAGIEAGHLAALLPLPSNTNKPEHLDQMELAYLMARDRLLVRLHPPMIRLLEADLPENSRAAFRERIPAPELSDDEDLGFDENRWTTAMPALAAHLEEHLPASHPWKPLWRHAEGHPASDWRAASHPLGGAILRNRSRLGATRWPMDPADIGRQTNTADIAVPLDDHSHGVSARSRANARAAGLPEALVEVLRDTGLLHDLGKLDPRFQAWLHGCSLWAVAAKPPVAKSSDFRPPATNRFLRDQAGVPKGFRHELLSALLAKQAIDPADYPERNLLLHLLASHHGRCRAVAPVVPDPEPETFEADVLGKVVDFKGSDCPLASFAEGVPERFWLLTRRFGWWGLPYLESLLRLADQRESADPSPVSKS